MKLTCGQLCHGSAGLGQTNDRGPDTYSLSMETLAEGCFSLKVGFSTAMLSSV
jgi:hypothetical protein